jgi:hypothetical protein
VCGSCVTTSAASAANIYVLSSGDPTIDGAVVSTLTSFGHIVTIGDPFNLFVGTENLSGFQTVYMQANANWPSTAMPDTGQQALTAFVNGGGRLVTCEWTEWLCASQVTNYATLSAIIPVVFTTLTYGSTTPVTYTAATANVAINAGLPSSFTFPVNNYGGTESYTTARPGATTYYTTSSSPGSVGLTGWRVGQGYVFSFSTTNGPNQLADTNFGRLFSNVMTATATGCYANCDNSTSPPILNTNDFQCFLNQFAAGSAYANCDNSTSPPTLNVNDFQCFLNKFAVGCN